MRRLFYHIRRHWLGYLFGIFCTIAFAVLQMILPILIRDAIDAIQKDNFARLIHIAEVMGVLALMMGITRMFSRFVIFNNGRHVEYEMRDALFTHLSNLGPAFYERLKTGDLMSRMINDLTAVRMMVGMGVLSFTSTPVTYVLGLVFMFSLNAKLTLACLIPYVTLFIIMRFLTHSLMERSLKVQEGLGAIGAKVQESLSGIHVVKAYTLEQREAERFRTLNDEYNEQGLALARVRGAIMPLIRGAVATSVMILIIYGGALIEAHQLTIGDLAAFLVYLGYLAWPTVSLGWMISIYQRAKASMKRLEEIFQAEPIPSIPGNAIKLVVDGAVEWDNVSFSYFARDGLDDIARAYALKNISVKVPAGHKLAIVGRTGSGKSTMTKLLARLIEPTSGRVLLDGRDLRELPLPSLRRTVGVVPQEPTLFSDTMARNIAFGKQDATTDEIETAAYIAGLAGEVAVLPHGLETIVGERGMSLSGGQKQRVTIARLLTYDPAIVVLDDALSSVDTETERAVLHSLSENVKGRTTIVVSHRASTVRGADEIIVLEDGLIAERGTHEQLMARRGTYAELFRRQLLEEELARY
ncbi:MAG: ABC transporter ATP-binding protein [Candidatus Binataceae bacterium]